MKLSYCVMSQTSVIGG